jgi:DNA-binding MarR family transcriptional regulator
MSVTDESFDAFRISPDHLEAIAALSTLSIAPTVARSNRATAGLPGTPSGTPSASRTFTPAELFRRGIKRDPSLFPTLKDEQFHDNWHRSFNNQARAQGVSEILDATYKPANDSETELFQEKQMYLYAVLEAKVLTDKGKAIVREHENDFDAQSAYAKLVEHHLRSTKAKIESAKTLSYITSTRIGNGEWQGTAEGFILHWADKVRLYERQVPSTDHFSDGQKRTMLENAVAPLEELRQVKNNADLHTTRTGESLTYDQYSNLLLSAASAYDSMYTQSKSQTKQRNVYFHNTAEDDYDDENGSCNSDGELYDIDCPIGVIQANVHDRNQYKSSRKNQVQRTFMERDKWLSLTEKDRKIWNQMGEKAKSVILGSTSANHDYGPNNNYDSSNKSTEEATKSEGNSARESSESEESSETRLIQAAMHGNKTGSLHPGDIRRVLSTSNKKNTT